MIQGRTALSYWNTAGNILRLERLIWRIGARSLEGRGVGVRRRTISSQGWQGTDGVHPSRLSRDTAGAETLFCIPDHPGYPRYPQGATMDCLASAGLWVKSTVVGYLQSCIPARLFSASPQPCTPGFRQHAVVRSWSFRVGDGPIRLRAWPSCANVAFETADEQGGQAH